MTYPSVTRLLEGREIDQEYDRDMRCTRKTLALHIVSQCQCRCDYCVSNMYRADIQARSTIVDEMGVDAYCDALKPIIERWDPVISLPGAGEPTIAKGFVEICHTLRRQPIRLFSNFIDVSGVEMLIDDGLDFSFNASYHVGHFIATGNDKRRRIVFDNLKRVLPGHDAQVIVPLSPEALEDWERVSDELLELRCEGVTMHPLELVHVYKGKRYPDAYTARERDLLRLLIGRTGTVRNMPADREVLKYMGDTMALRGMPCWVGLAKVSIAIDGTMSHCMSEPRNSIGHLQHGYDLEWLYDAEPRVCPYSRCTCQAVGTAMALAGYGIDVAEYVAEYQQALGNRAAYADIKARMP